MEKIFDTHAHYDDEAFDPDRDELLRGLPENGIEKVVNVGASLASCRRTLELMNRYEHVYGALGVHPSETAELDEEALAWLRQQCQVENVWRWGKSDWIIIGMSRTERCRRNGLSGSWGLHGS